MPSDSPASTYEATRVALHRIAVHVLGRGRAGASGRFGLRPSVDGLATPAFGPEAEVLRLAGTTLLRERHSAAGYATAAIEVAGRSLTELATHADLDLAVPFSVGTDTPPVGDPAAPISLDPASVTTLFATFDLGARALDRILPTASEPSVVQVWPEHFDLAVDVAVGSDRLNLGVSPGDGFSARPYLYVGPWSDARPGGPAFWNAPFGAALEIDALPATGADRTEAAVAFFVHGLDLLR